MCVHTEYDSSTRIGPPPAVRDAYSCTTVLALSASSSAGRDYFTSSVRSGNLLSGFDETFETFRLPQRNF